MTDSAPVLDRNTALALDRTRLAHDRTLLAWVRTSTSLISFGFSIYKGFQYLRESSQLPPNESLLGPRGFAMIMLATGVIVLILATVEHKRSVSELRREYTTVPRSLATLLAAFISLLGVLGLLSVIFRF